MKKWILLCVMGCTALLGLRAQGVVDLDLQRRQVWERRFYTHVQWVQWEGDTIPFFQFRDVIVYPPLKFKNDKERQAYLKLVRDVKKVQPLADMIQGILIESYEFMKDMTPKQQQAHIKQLESGLMKQYKPELKKLTFTQGKLLIKLVDRQCASSTYDIIKSFAGTFRAGFYQSFAAIFGASLKKEYNAKGDDKLTERVLTLVLNYQL